MKNSPVDSLTDSDESFHSASEFCVYEVDLDPIANENEAKEYSMEIECENEQKEALLRRFSGELEIFEW